LDAALKPDKAPAAFDFEIGPDEELVIGPKAVLEALKARSGLLRRIAVSSGRRDKLSSEIRARAERAGVMPSSPSRSAFVLPPGLNHQGVAAAFGLKRSPGLEEFMEGVDPGRPSLILALDHLSDPGNTGALIRTALAFGADAAISPLDRAAGLAPAAIKAAQGASEHLPFITVTNLNSALKALKGKGWWIYGADLSRGGEEGIPAFAPRSVIALGGESRGLSRLTSGLCDFFVKIPMNPKAGSLNVAAAGAVLMHAWMTQHGL
jgi:23S rRNA (guanosine2251-2'-O)-methyltransferase